MCFCSENMIQKYLTEWKAHQQTHTIHSEGYSVRAATSALTFPFCCKLWTESFLLGEKKKRGKCRRKVLRVELQRGRRTFLSVSPTRRQTDGYSQVVSNLSACAGLHRARLPHPFRELRGGYLGCWWRQLPGKKPGRFEGGCPIFFFSSASSSSSSSSPFPSPVNFLNTHAERVNARLRRGKKVGRVHVKRARDRVSRWWNICRPVVHHYAPMVRLRDSRLQLATTSEPTVGAPSPH